MQSAESGPSAGGQQRSLRVLFLCTGNSARSQIAEARANSLPGGRHRAWSAGTAPRDLDPRAVAVMAEVGIDLGARRSKHVAEVRDVPFDLVVTVCDAARESCPVSPGAVRHEHVGIDDRPRLAAAALNEWQARASYRRVRDEIPACVESLASGITAREGRGARE